MPVVKVSLRDADLIRQMRRIRAWLDDRRYVPAGFYYKQLTKGLTVHIRFKNADEAEEFVRLFGGQGAVFSRKCGKPEGLPTGNSVDGTMRSREVAHGGMKKFEVCRDGRGPRWFVRLNSAIYGSYLNKEQALFDAVDAARDAQHAGCEVQVWLRDRTGEERVL